MEEDGGGGGVRGGGREEEEEMLRPANAKRRAVPERGLVTFTKNSTTFLFRLETICIEGCRGADAAEVYRGIEGVKCISY